MHRIWSGLARKTALPMILVVVGVLGAATPAAAQWRNLGVQLPNVGWLALGNSTDFVNDAVNNARWGANDQLTIGAGFFAAIGYSLWSDSQVAIGFGTSKAPRDGQANVDPIFSLAVSTGLRWNILDEKVRPFLAAHIQLLTLINPLGNPGIPTNATSGVPTWIGPRLSGGVEIFFIEEQSLQFEIGAVALLGFSDGGFLRPSAIGRASWNVYF